MMILIFCFSAQPAEDSTAASDMISRVILCVAEKVKVLDEQRVDVTAFLELMSYPVRKSAHMTEYGILALSFQLALSGQGLRGRRCLGFALLLTVLYAATDEVHQLFVPGRAGLVTDVMIDGLGAVIFLGILSGVRKLRQKEAVA